jgi:hypothetical protein
VNLESLFQDWAEVVRTLKKLTTIEEFEKKSRHSARRLRRRFGSWAVVPEGMKAYAIQEGLAEEWQDVLDLINVQPQGQKGAAAVSTTRPNAKAVANRPVYGPVIHGCVFVYGPTNEMGVVGLFTALAERLGFRILRMRTEYPDCEAMRVVERDQLQPLNIEFEYESKNFVKHLHDPKRCDMIVCWIDNWLGCPLEVLELRKVVEVQRAGKLQRLPQADTSEAEAER